MIINDSLLLLLTNRLTISCRIVGNIAASASPKSTSGNASIYEPVANFQLCVWDDARLRLALPCPNMTVDGNIAAGSSHFGFLAQVCLMSCEPHSNLRNSQESFCQSKAGGLSGKRREASVYSLHCKRGFLSQHTRARRIIMGVLHM